MALKPLSLGLIQCGQLVENINAQLEKISRDAIERPMVPGKRTLTVKIHIEPRVDDNGLERQNYPEITNQLSTTIPAVVGMRTRGLVMPMGKGKGQVIGINTNDPLGTDPGAATLLDALDGDYEE